MSSDLPHDASQRAVSFAQPIAEYRTDLDALLDLSSSSEESDGDANFYNSSAPVAVLKEEENVCGQVTSSYLERYDYKALLASLQANDQHDTAKHLMSVSMLKQEVLQGIRPSDGCRLPRKGWTAWPLPPDQTKHSRGARSELQEELNALLHRAMTAQLRREGKVVSADPLDDVVANGFTNIVLDKVDILLQRIGRGRYSQGSRSASTMKRLDPLDYTDVLQILHESKILSNQGERNVVDRCRNLFCPSSGSGTVARLPTSEESTENFLVEDRSVLSKAQMSPDGRSRRGRKRRKIVREPECLHNSVPSLADLDTVSENAMVSRENSSPVHSPRVRVQSTGDSGRRSAKDVLAVPLDLAKQDEGREQ